MKKSILFKSILAGALALSTFSAQAAEPSSIWSVPREQVPQEVASREAEIRKNLEKLKKGECRGCFLPYTNLKETLKKARENIDTHNKSSLWAKFKNGIGLGKRLDLRHADLTASDCSHGNFEDGFLDFADCSKARFQNARLDRARLLFTSFENADLNSARLNKAHLSETNFKNANLSLARAMDLRGGTLCSTFEGADCQNTSFDKSYLVGAKFDKANCSGASFNDAGLIGASCKKADFTNAKFGSPYSSLVLRAFLYPTHVSHANFEGANCRGALFHTADLTEANFNGTNLERAHFHNSKLEETRLQDANCNGASFRDSKLVKTDMTGASVKDASFERTSLVNANLSKTGVTDKQLHACRKVSNVLRTRWSLLKGYISYITHLG